MIAQTDLIKEKIYDIKDGKIQEGLKIGVPEIDEYIRYRPKKGVLRKWLAKNQWSDRIDEFLRLSNIDSQDGIKQLGVEV